MKKIGFIDYFLDEWHANNYPAWIKEATGGEMEVAYAYALIDSPLGGLPTDQWCEKNGITRCGSIEEIIEKSDCLIVLSPDNCEHHEGLCQLPLRCGKPTYVDKTFAPDGAVARRLMAIAEQSGTPCYSSSALRFAAEYQDIDRAGITAISSWGPANLETYCIHQLEPILMLMQAPVKRVLYTEGDKWYTALLEFTDGRQATMAGFLNGSPFCLNIASDSGNTMVKAESDFFKPFIAELCDFFNTGEIKVPHEDTIRIMETRGAVLRASKTPGQWVDL